MLTEYRDPVTVTSGAVGAEGRSQVVQNSVTAEVVEQSTETKESGNSVALVTAGPSGMTGSAMESNGLQSGHGDVGSSDTEASGE